MPISQISIKYGGELAKTLIKNLELEVDAWTPEIAEAVEENRKAEMQKRGLTEVRKGRGDTGTHVFNQEAMEAVRISNFITDLIDAGYQFVAITAQRKPRYINGKMMRNKYIYTVTALFSIEEDDEPLEDEELKEFQAHVEGLATEFCHIWKNDTCDTVNLAGKITTPKQDLRISTSGVYGLYPAT